MNNFVWMTAKKAYLSSEMNAFIRIHLLLIYKYSFFTRNPEIFRRKNNMCLQAGCENMSQLNNCELIADFSGRRLDAMIINMRNR